MPHFDPAVAAASHSNPDSPVQMEVDPAAAAAPSGPADDEDFVMVEAGDLQGVSENPEPVPEPPSAQALAQEADEDGVEIKKEQRPDIKLEDLFAGMDSDDDEFPSSSNSVKEEQQT